VAPQRDQHVQAQASESLEPGALGQRTEHTRGQIFIPAPHAAQFGVRAAPEQWGKHHPDDFSQKLLLAVQAPFDLSHEVFRQPHVTEGLLEGLGGVLRLAAGIVQDGHCITIACNAIRACTLASRSLKQRRVAQSAR